MTFSDFAVSKLPVFRGSADPFAFRAVVSPRQELRWIIPAPAFPNHGDESLRIHERRSTSRRSEFVELV